MQIQLLEIHLFHNGYIVIKDFLGSSDFHPELNAFILNADKFSDGVITSIPQPYMAAVTQRINSTLPDLAKALDLQIATNRFGYCAIRIDKSTEEPQLKKPFNYHQDPKVAPGGVLNWHIDHYSYYLNKDHTNWLICYIPIFKPSKELANLAIVPTDVVMQHDPYLHQQIAG